MHLDMDVWAEDLSHFTMPRVVMISFGQGLPPFLQIEELQISAQQDCFAFVMSVILPSDTGAFLKYVVSILIYT